MLLFQSVTGSVRGTLKQSPGPYNYRVNSTPLMATPIFSLSPEMQSTWDDIMGQMVAFVNDTNADVDMAYDWVCEMLDIDTFVDNEKAWNSFYDAWESCDNRNTMEYGFFV